MKNYIVRANRELDNPFDVFGNAFDGFFKPLFYDEKFDSMKTDIKETDNSYELEIEMPGFEKGDIDISLENEYLTITAEKAEKAENKDSNRYLRKERSVSCQRSYYVGDIKEADIKAKYANGVLELSVPKAEPEKPTKRNISID
ncbi:MAG: Hsp20/alpha crystallin family protein [Clostridia bacterium]